MFWIDGDIHTKNGGNAFKSIMRFAWCSFPSIFAVNTLINPKYYYNDFLLDVLRDSRVILLGYTTAVCSTRGNIGL